GALVPIARERPGPDDVESAAAPGADAGRPDGATSAQPLGAMSLLRMWPFWTIGVSAGLTLGAGQALMITLVPLAQTGGCGAGAAGRLISVWSPPGLLR